MSNMTTPPDEKHNDSSALKTSNDSMVQQTINESVEPSDEKSHVNRVAQSEALSTSPSSVSSSIAAQAQTVESISKPTAKVAAKTMSQKCCENCGFELDGSFCGRCGQPERSTIKFFGTVILHFLDDIFGFDSRAGRTILPLVFRPGFLTCEYFGGRRVHYVPPLRLYFFVSITFFLMLELFTDDSVKELKQIQQANGQESIAIISEEIAELKAEMSTDSYEQNQNDERQLKRLERQKSQVEQDVREQITQLEQTIIELNPEQLPLEQLPIGVQMSIKALKQTIDGFQMNLNESPNYTGVKLIQNQLSLLDEAQKKMNGKLSESDQKKRQELEAQLTKIIEKDTKQIGLIKGKDGGPKLNINFKPDIEWLAPEQNKQLELFLVDMEKKAKIAFEQDATPLVNQVLGVLPQMMFFLLPIFALILKIFYLFSKRFYMEHLTVALHSHAFIFVVLMILAIVSSFYQYLPVDKDTALQISETIVLALVCWMPIYLFLMQKKVYRQGVFMTLCKYCIVGMTYMMLLVLATFIAFFWGLAHT